MSTKKPKPAAEAETPVPMFDIGDASQKPIKPASSERIHANHCVVGMECNMTDGCNGRLEHTRGTTIFGHNGIQVQFFCPRCRQFADGHRPLAGVAKLGPPVLFDRSSGKVK